MTKPIVLENEKDAVNAVCDARKKGGGPVFVVPMDDGRFQLVTTSFDVPKDPVKPKRSKG